MPHTPVPNLRNVYNGRAMVSRVQHGGKVSIQQDPAMAPLPAAAKKPAVSEAEDKKAIRSKLMAEVYRNL